MNEVQLALRDRYPNIHPLIFQRSIERSRTDGELFDILEDVPKELPIVWDDKTRRWTHTNDLLQGKFEEDKQ